MEELSVNRSTVLGRDEHMKAHPFFMLLTLVCIFLSVSFCPQKWRRVSNMSKRRSTTVSENPNKRLRSAVNGGDEEDEEDRHVNESDEEDSLLSRRVCNLTASVWIYVDNCVLIWCQSDPSPSLLYFFYTARLWCNNSKSVMKKLLVAYQDAFRLFLRLPRWSSASQMFVESNVPTFHGLLRNNVQMFVPF